MSAEDSGKPMGQVIQIDEARIRDHQQSKTIHAELRWL